MGLDLNHHGSRLEHAKRVCVPSVQSGFTFRQGKAALRTTRGRKAGCGALRFGTLSWLLKCPEKESAPQAKQTLDKTWKKVYVKI
jgi:hypothetical protein